MVWKRDDIRVREGEFTKQIKPPEVVDDSVEIDRSVTREEMMEKDNSVKFGSTKCDLCDAPAVGALGSTVVCENHLKTEMHKRAGDNHVPLKSVAAYLAEKHQQK